MSTNVAQRPSAPQATRPTTALLHDPLRVLRQEFDDLIGRIWDGKPENWLASTFSPAMDLTESANSFQVRMDVPGMEPTDIDVRVHGNVVTVTGEKKEEKEEKGKRYHRIERRSGNFSRTFTLPCAVNEDEVAADYSKGVLTLELPKCEEAKSKKINVKG